MLDIRPEDLLHKSHLHRLLMEIVDQPVSAQSLAFKGGTCAAMLGYLDRFSVDLDFDVLPGTDENKIRSIFHSVFNQLGLITVHEYDNVLFFQLRYSASPGQRNSIKISATRPEIRSNHYKVQVFPEIDRLINAQTIETMFANKLVAATDRYTRHRTIAGRDIYDIHHFFVSGYGYSAEVIRDRTNLEPKVYFGRLADFIHQHVTRTVINEDLNSLLPDRQFQQIRKILGPETLSLLAGEIHRLSK